MRSRYQILLPLLSLFFVRVDLTDLFPIYFEVKVLKIYDGDTVLVSHRSLKFKVRLDKIDAPEMKQPTFKGKKDAGLISKQCLKKILAREKKIMLKIRTQDIYGRVLGEINRVSFKMINLGCASLYPYALFSSKKEKFHYLRAFKKAKSQGLGLWAWGGIRRPDLWRKFNKQTVHRELRQ